MAERPPAPKGDILFLLFLVSFCRDLLRRSWHPTEVVPGCRRQHKVLPVLTVDAVSCLDRSSLSDAGSLLRP